MIYIDKTTNRNDGDAKTKYYLEHKCKNPATMRFMHIRYKDEVSIGEKFSGTRVYRDMRTLLLSEQNNYCCYCLRKIGDEPLGSATIEHIIPESCPPDDLAKYRTAPNLKATQIILTNDFEAATVQTMPPYPHTVAYRNFVVSCNGTFPNKREGKGKTGTKQCCNNKRGNEYVFPVYFRKHIHGNVKYKPNGTMQPQKGCKYKREILNLIENTGLYCEPLKEIRHLWYELRNCDINTIIACEDETARDALFTTNLSDLTMDEDLIKTYKKDEYWNTLMLYDKFHEIMRQQYPA